MGLPHNLGRLSPAITSDASLNIGIGVTPSGTYKLEVNGTVGFNGALTGTSASFTGQLTAGSSSSQTPASISTNSQANQPALTLFKNIFTGTGEDVFRIQSFTSGAVNVFTVKDNGATAISGALSGTSASFSSTASATAFIPTASSIPTNGMYLSGTNTLDFATNNVNRLRISSGGAATFASSLTAPSVNVVTNSDVVNQTADDVTLATHTAGSSNELLQITITMTNNNATGQVRSTFNYTTDNNNSVSLAAIATTPNAAYGQGQAVIALYIKNGTTLTIKSLITVGAINYSSRIAITKIL